MHSIKIWVSEHPYLTGAFVIGAIVLIFILRSRSSASASVSAVASGPSPAQLAAGVQSQQISAAASADQSHTAAQLAATMAGLQVQEDQISAAKQVALQQTLTGGETAQYSAQAQLAAAQSHDAASVAANQTNANATVQVAGINANAGIQIANIGASRDISVAGIQADVSKTNIAAQLAGLLDTNKTSIDLAGISLAGLKDTNATKLAATVDTNKTAAEINAQNQGTQQLGISTQGDVAKTAIAASQEVNDRLINTTGAIDALQITTSADLQKQNQTEYWKSIFADDRWGSGENQVSALAALTNQPAIGVAAQQGQAQSNVAESGMWASVAGSVAKFGSGLLGGFFGGGGGSPAPTPSVTSTFTPGAPVSASVNV